MSAPEASGAYTHEDIVAELNFVIAERRGTINSIRRERKESEKVKAIRIAICEKMIERTRAARAVVEAYPDLLDIVRRLVRADDEAPDFGLADCIDNTGEHYQSADFAALIIVARAAIARALGQSSTEEG